MNKFVSELCEKLPDLKVQDIVFNSSLNPALDGHGDGAEILKHFLLRKPVTHVLEIGTYNGLATAFMAQFADQITTIDIEDYPIKRRIWDALGVGSKITSIVVKDEEEKKNLIDSLDFDVAFVDGNHFDEYPRTDFEMVKHCGRVILHDYHKDFPDVVEFVDSIDPNTREIKGLFCYWENSLSPQVSFPEFNYNLGYVDKYLEGVGLDMGCGCCPLPKPNCLHFDISPQPLTIERVGNDFFQADTTMPLQVPPGQYADYIFSSHMIEDLPTKKAIVKCLTQWAEHLRPGGHIILLLPDMQGGRYPTVEDGGNPSHQVNVGAKFIKSLKLKGLKLVQMDTIPHDKSCTLDVVFKKGKR